MINFGDYRFFLGGCKIFGLFLVVFLVGVVGFDICDFLESGFARWATYFFFARAKQK